LSEAKPNENIPYQQKQLLFIIVCFKPSLIDFSFSLRKDFLSGLFTKRLRDAALLEGKYYV
jgi:hypothetical protein